MKDALVCAFCYSRHFYILVYLGKHGGLTSRHMDMNRLRIRWARTLLLAFIPLQSQGETIPIVPQWSRQIGFTDSDFLWDSVTDKAGNTFSVGSSPTFNPNLNDDGFVVGVDTSGNQLWLNRIGTPAFDSATGVSLDANGNVYVAGSTGGNGVTFPGGSSDGFVSRYSPAGNLAWTRQLGTVEYDGITDVATDRMGSIFVSGNTEGNLGGPNSGSTDAFLAKYNSDGMLIWTKQFGTEKYERARTLVTDALGDIYVTGITRGSFTGSIVSGRRQLFVSKFDGDGNVKWILQSGSLEYEDVFDAAIGPTGDLVLSGLTRGLGGDGFVVACSSTGQILSELKYGTDYYYDAIAAVLPDSFGNIYIGGNTDGSLDGIYFEELGSAFIAQLDLSHHRQWVYQFGKQNGISRLSTDALGNLYAAGISLGAETFPTQGCWLIKFAVPEPSTLTIIALMTALWVTSSRQRLL